MRDGNRGQVIIVFALCLLVLLGFAALAIDVGYMYSVRGDLQRCADAGALAGAYIFHNGGWMPGQPAPGNLRTDAMDRARNFATRDPVGGAPLDNTAVTFSFPFDTDSSKVNQIQVNVQDNVNLFFAGVIGSPTVMLSATAIAFAESVGQNVPCLKPFGIPIPYINNVPPNDRFNSGDTPLPADCITGNLCQGTQIVLRIARPFNPSGSGIVRRYRVRLESGGLFAMRFCGDNSGNYQNRIRLNCYDDRSCSQFDLANPVDLMPRGSTFSPINTTTINRINDLYNAYPASWNSTTKLPESPAGSPWEGDNWMHSPRVLRVLLYDPQEVANNPDTRIRIRGFAGFWIEAVNVGAQTVTGRFIPANAVGDSSPAPALIQPSLKTTRLVQ